VSEEHLTIRDDRGASLVVERWENGRLAAWIVPPGDNDGPSVVLNPDAQLELAAYLLAVE
jgi:hypothetical protein